MSGDGIATPSQVGGGEWLIRQAARNLQPQVADTGSFEWPCKWSYKSVSAGASAQNVFLIVLAMSLSMVWPEIHPSRLRAQVTFKDLTS